MYVIEQQIGSMPLAIYLLALFAIIVIVSEVLILLFKGSTRIAIAVLLLELCFAIIVPFALEIKHISDTVPEQEVTQDETVHNEYKEDEKYQNSDRTSYIEDEAESKHSSDMVEYTEQENVSEIDKFLRMPRSEVVSQAEEISGEADLTWEELTRNSYKYNEKIVSA